MVTALLLALAAPIDGSYQIVVDTAGFESALGAVVDGLARDVKKIRQLGFPVFARGIKPVDSKGRGIVVECSRPVSAGGIVVSPGT